MDGSGLQYLRARYYTPAQGRFLPRDSWQGDYTRPASLHRYTYAENNPVLYTDPSGQCVFAGIDTAICVGAAIGAAVSYGSQVYNNYQNGMSGVDAWRCVNVGDILIGAGAGAVAGAVGFVGAGFGAAVWGTSFWATVGTGAFSSVLAGQYGRLAQLAFSGQWDQVSTTLFRPQDILLDALTGGLASAAGYKLAQALKNFKTAGQYADDLANASNYCSFSEETPVNTEEGLEPIGELEIGDKVLAYNEETGETGYYPVTATWSHTDPVILHLTIDGEEIETTPEHPFYTSAGEWLAAEDLQVGAYIQTAEGSYGTVEKIATEHRV